MGLAQCPRLVPRLREQMPIAMRSTQPPGILSVWGRLDRVRLAGEEQRHRPRKLRRGEAAGGLRNRKRIVKRARLAAAPRKSPPPVRETVVPSVGDNTTAGGAPTK